MPGTWKRSLVFVNALLNFKDLIADRAPKFMRRDTLIKLAKP